MSRRQTECQCGCGRFDFPNKMTEVVIQEPTDNTMRTIRTVGRLRVLRVCKEPFEEELGMQQFLKVISIRYRPYKNQGVWKLLCLPRTIYRYLRRLHEAWRVMRLTHAIHERGRMIRMGEVAGFKWTKDHAIRTAILFGAPFFLQGFLNRRFLLRAQRRQAKINATKQIPTEETADAA